MMLCSRCGGNHMRIECYLEPKIVGNVKTSDNTYATQIWNEAIEAAAKLFDQPNIPITMTSYNLCLLLSVEIRKLKK